MKQKCCHKRVLIVAGCSRSRAVAQQLDLLPLGAFYITPLRLSARMGYARSAFHSFLFSFFLSPSLNFFNQKRFFIGALEKQTQHTAASFVTEPIKNEIH